MKRFADTSNIKYAVGCVPSARTRRLGIVIKLRRELEDMGFSISEDGKHFKLVFQGDDRYTFTLPKSGSDWRGGLNAASDIGRLLF